MATLRLMLLGLLAAAVAACASVAAEPRPTHFYVIRHLQKAEGQDPGLTAAGRRNAEILAGLLEQAPPSAIYASATRRARETAQPAAARYGLTLKEYDPRDTPGLIARVRAEPGTVLIVGHSNTVPAIVGALGGGRIGEIGENDYGILYRFARSGGNLIRIRVDENCRPRGGGDQFRC